MQPPILNQAQHVPELLGKGLTWFGNNLPALAGNLVWVVIVPIIAFFILLDFNKILGKTLLLVPRDKREGILAVVTDIIAVFGSYVRGVLTVMALDICVIFAVLWFAGLRDYALTLAITAGLLYTIPYFGALVSTILIGLVSLATHGLVTAIVITLIMIFIHQIVFDNIVAPRVIGGSVNLHPLLTLLALMAGGTLFGIGGTLLAVPIAAAFQVILVHLFPQFKTDVVAVRRAANVVQKTIAKDTEEDKPPLAKKTTRRSCSRKKRPPAPSRKGRPLSCRRWTRRRVNCSLPTAPRQSAIDWKIFPTHGRWKPRVADRRQTSACLPRPQSDTSSRHKSSDPATWPGLQADAKSGQSTRHAARHSLPLICSLLR